MNEKSRFLVELCSMNCNIDRFCNFEIQIRPWMKNKFWPILILSLYRVSTYILTMDSWGWKNNIFPLSFFPI